MKPSTRKPPLALHLNNLDTPLLFFRALFSDEIVDHICSETGLIHHDEKNEPLSRTHLFKYFGQELIRGYLGIRDIRHLWSTGEISISYPKKNSGLWKNHWYAISAGISVDLEYVHKLLVERFKFYLMPGFHVTIDEIRIPCSHEACPFKNHNRDKPDIWAIESKSLHAENGYLVDFIYPCQQKVPTPSESLFHFAGWLQNTGRQHHMVCDSNFLSVYDLPKLERWD